MHSIILRLVCFGKPSKVETSDNVGGCTEPAVCINSQTTFKTHASIDSRIALAWSNGVTPQMVSANMVVMRRRTVLRARFV